MNKSRSFGKGISVLGGIAILAMTMIAFDFLVDVKALNNFTIGDPFSPFCGEGMDGKKICSSEFKDNVVITTFIKLGQPQSHEVMQILQDLLASYQGKDVSIVVIASGEVDLKALMAFREENRLTFPIILDESREIYGRYGVIAYPTTILVGRDKKIHSLFGSAMTSFKRRLDGSVRYLLEEINEEELERIEHPVRETADQETVRNLRYYNGARKYFDQMQFAKAERLIKISLKEHPEHALSLSLYGYILMQKKQYKRALEQFDKALKLNPDLEEAKRGREICLDNDDSQ